MFKLNKRNGSYPIVIKTQTEIFALPNGVDTLKEMYEAGIQQNKEIRAIEGFNC